MGNFFIKTFSSYIFKSARELWKKVESLRNVNYITIVIFSINKIGINYYINILLKLAGNVSMSFNGDKIKF